MEDARLIHPALGHHEMQMRMEIDAVSERLDDRNDPGLERPPRRGLKIQEKRRDGTAAELTQELALELEEHPQHLGHREDHLTVRNIEEERLPHPLPPFLQPLGMTRGTESPGLAGKHQKMLRQEAFKMMEQYPVKNGPLRMTRTIDARHIQERRSRNGPGKNKRQFPGEDARIRVRNSPRFLKKTSTFADGGCGEEEAAGASRILFPPAPASEFPMLGAADDFVLELGAAIDEVIAVARHPHDQNFQDLPVFD